MINQFSQINQPKTEFCAPIRRSGAGFAFFITTAEMSAAQKEKSHGMHNPDLHLLMERSSCMRIQPLLAAAALACGSMFVTVRAADPPPVVQPADPAFTRTEIKTETKAVAP